MSHATTTCSTCGAVLPAAMRFCPECGMRLGGADAVRTYNVAPAAALLWTAGGTTVLGIVLLALGHWTGAAILLAVGAVLAAVHARSAGPSSGAQQRLAKLRTRSRAVVELVSTHAEARRGRLALQRELEQLQATRDAWLRDLGRAVYDEDAAGSERGKRAIRELDAQIAAKEEQMTHVAVQAQERIQHVRAAARPTELLEPPMPAPVPEPFPPPDEGTPPQPG